MPRTISVSRRIQAPVNVVWQVATDLAGSAGVLSGVTAVEVLTDAPFGAGTRWRETRVMRGRPVTEEMWISAVEPLRSYAAEAESHGAHYTSVFTFVPTGADSTEATLDFTVRPLSTASRVATTLLAPVTTRAVRGALQADLADLAAAAEQLAG
jgi:hypothetical protein